jgi:hypothetical protein
MDTATFIRKINNTVSDLTYSTIYFTLKSKHKVKNKTFASVILRDEKLLYKDTNIPPTDFKELIPVSRRKEIILENYQNSKTGYGGKQEMYNRLRQKYIGVTLKSISEILENLESYQLNRKVPKQTKIPRIFTQNRDTYFQADLVDMSSLSRYNKGIHWLLNVVDCSPYKTVFSIPLKSKSAKDTADGFKKLFEIVVPKMIQTDLGKEFINSDVAKVFKNNNVKHIIPKEGYVPQRNGRIERMNGVIKNKIKRYMVDNKTHKYIDVLEDLVDNINTYYENHPPSEQQIQERKELSEETNDLEKNDKVRIYQKALKEFRKNKLAKPEYNWTKEIYSITRVYKPQKNFTTYRYLLSDGHIYHRCQLLKINEVYEGEEEKEKDENYEEEKKEIRKEKKQKKMRQREGVEEKNIIVNEPRKRKQRNDDFMISDYSKFF